MIKLAMEAPTVLLGDLPHITEFDWVLTHMCEESEEYFQHYKDMSLVPNREVVLDNSVNELGEPLSLERMDLVAKELCPTYIVPPDYLNDLSKTLSILDDAISLWGQTKIMPVIQGESIEEVVECGQILRNKYGFSTVAIPYDVMLAHRSKLPSSDPDRASLSELADTRVKAVTSLTEAEVKFRRYHLLGMNTLEEFPRYRNPEVWTGGGAWGGVRPIVTVDTGAPFTNAVYSRRFKKEALVPKGIYFDYNIDPNQEERTELQKLWYWNILILRGILHGV